MNKVKKGDIVARISHGKDILFIVKKIIRLKDGKKIALLKGITERIEANSYLDDLCLMQKEIIENNLRSLDFKLESRIKQNNIYKEKHKGEINKRTNEKKITGKILHLDGDSCLDNKNSH